MQSIGKELNEVAFDVESAEYFEKDAGFLKEFLRGLWSVHSRRVDQWMDAMLCLCRPLCSVCRLNDAGTANG